MSVCSQLPPFIAFLSCSYGQRNKKVYHFINGWLFQCTNNSSYLFSTFFNESKFSFFFFSFIVIHFELIFSFFLLLRCHFSQCILYPSSGCVLQCQTSFGKRSILSVSFISYLLPVTDGQGSIYTFSEQSSIYQNWMIVLKNLTLKKKLIWINFKIQWLKASLKIKLGKYKKLFVLEVTT